MHHKSQFAKTADTAKASSRQSLQPDDLMWLRYKAFKVSLTPLDDDKNLESDKTVNINPYYISNLDINFVLSGFSGSLIFELSSELESCPSLDVVLKANFIAINLEIEACLVADGKKSEEKPSSNRIKLTGFVMNCLGEQMILQRIWFREKTRSSKKDVYEVKQAKQIVRLKFADPLTIFAKTKALECYTKKSYKEVFSSILKPFESHITLEITESFAAMNAKRNVVNVLAKISIYDYIMHVVGRYAGFVVFDFEHQKYQITDDLKPAMENRQPHGSKSLDEHVTRFLDGIDVCRCNGTPQACKAININPVLNQSDEEISLDKASLPQGFGINKTLMDYSVSEDFDEGVKFKKKAYNQRYSSSYQARVTFATIMIDRHSLPLVPMDLGTHLVKMFCSGVLEGKSMISEISISFTHVKAARNVWVCPSTAKLNKTHWYKTDIWTGDRSMKSLCDNLDFAVKTTCMLVNEDFTNFLDLEDFKVHPEEVKAQVIGEDGKNFAKLYDGEGDTTVSLLKASKAKGQYDLVHGSMCPQVKKKLAQGLVASGEDNEFLSRVQNTSGLHHVISVPKAGCVYQVRLSLESIDVIGLPLGVDGYLLLEQGQNQAYGQDTGTSTVTGLVLGADPALSAHLYQNTSDDGKKQSFVMQQNTLKDPVKLELDGVGQRFSISTGSVEE